jgi:hypothetical protein
MQIFEETPAAQIVLAVSFTPIPSSDAAARDPVR